MYQWRYALCFQAEDGIRDLVRSRGLGDVYKRQTQPCTYHTTQTGTQCVLFPMQMVEDDNKGPQPYLCLLYTSDAADERSSVDLGCRRIIKKITIRLSMTTRSTKRQQ